MKKIILSLLIIVIISAISYRVYTKYFSWNTYKNETYKYSITYPNNWFIDSEYSDKPIEMRSVDMYLGGDTAISNYQLIKDEEPNEKPDRVLIYYNFQKVNRSVAVDSFIDTKTISAEKVDTQDIEINGVKGIKYTILNLKGIDGNTKKNNTTILLKKDDLLLNISYGFDEGNKVNMKTVEKVINSIKW